MTDPFCYFNSSPEIIRLAVMVYIGFPLSQRNFEGLLHECRIDISHKTVRSWWNRLGPLTLRKIRNRRRLQFSAACLVGICNALHVRDCHTFRHTSPG